YLKRLQQNSGEWRHSTIIGATALAALTLLECDVDKEDPGIKAAAQFLRRSSANLTHTYSIALIIMFLDRLGDDQDKPLLETLTIRLLNGQSPTGGWSYNCPIGPQEARRLTGNVNEKGDPDKKPAGADNQDNDGRLPPNLPPAARQQLEKRQNQFAPAPPLNQPVVQPVNPVFRPEGDDSNTQFATLALRVARRQRFSLPVDKALALVEARFRASQNADGGWSYTPISGRTSPAMTSAGLLGLAVGYGVGSEAVMRTDL